MGDPTPRREGFGDIADRLTALEQQIEELKTPSGTQRVQGVEQIAATLAYLNSLKTHASNGANSVSLSNQAADGLTKWYIAGIGQDRSTWHTIGPIEVPTRRMIVTASIGEASLSPQGGYMIGYVSYRVLSGGLMTTEGGTVVRNYGTETGRLYTNTRLGVGLSTGPQLVEIPDEFPGPFYVVMNIAVWGATTNTGPVSGVFNSPALSVQIVG